MRGFPNEWMSGCMLSVPQPYEAQEEWGPGKEEVAFFAAHRGLRQRQASCYTDHIMKDLQVRIPELRVV